MPASSNKTVSVIRRWGTIVPCSLLALILAHTIASIYRIGPQVSLWFPPAGVAIALTLLFGPVEVLVVAIASIIVAPLWGSDGWFRLVGITDTVEPLVAWFLYRRLWQGSLSFSRLKHAAAFILSAPFAACAASALVGSFTLSILGKIPASNLGNSIMHWWLGNAIGTIAIAPTALLVLTPFLSRRGYLASNSYDSSYLPCNSVRFSRAIIAEILTICIFSLAAAVLTVMQTQNGNFTFQQLSFLTFIPMIWAATRFGVKGGMLTATFCVVMTLLAYLLVYPYNPSLPVFPVPPEVFHVHKLSLLIQCGVSLLFGCAIAERSATQIALAVERVQSREYLARAQLNEQLIKLNISLAESNQEKDQLLLREQAARSEAETANRLKDEFLAVLSHELRSPLHPILGWTQILKTGRCDEKTTVRALETIERNAKLQTQLIDDLLDISRIIQGKLNLKVASVNLIGIIEAAIETVSLSANTKSIDLNFSILDDPNRKFIVSGDPTRLQQIFWNILSNALKFTPEGGQVEIQLSLLIEDITQYAQITISDNGIGIPAEFLPYIFDYFRQADSSTTRKFGGLGLGLAIVRHLVKLHNGEVKAESPGEGKGATFTVKLPLCCD